MKKYISIDIGGTAIKYGLIDENDQILESHKMYTEASKGGPQILTKAISIVESYLGQGKENKDDIVGICISTAGVVDTKKGMIYHSAPLIPNYTGVNFKQTMEERFGINCEVENDVNCAGIAEYMSGSSKDSKLALMLTIGTGIGGCAILNGQVLHGVSGSACEVGYMKMGDSDFQTLGSAKTLVESVANMKGDDVGEWNGIRVFEEAKKNDKICMRAIDNMCDVLGQGIANICYILNPDTVVLGGGIMAQGDYLRDKIENSLRKNLEDGISRHTSLKFASHKNSAGMLGAYYNFRNIEKMSLR